VTTPYGGRGVGTPWGHPAAALAFLLSAPAINPIVLTATAVAFPRNPEMVLARFAASRPARWLHTVASIPPYGGQVDGHPAGTLRRC
jgi:hypothetical protein